MLECINLCKDYPSHRGHRRVLNNVSFRLEKGEKLGILGRNGAGKSTLIRMIGGVEHISSGEIRNTMSISWPLAFGGAFQGSLSGLDNLRFICRIYNLDYNETRTYVDDFAQLGKQLADPVKTYSSGMRARLAFALSLVIDFDCYLIDEVIMVGDARFHQKCEEELFVKRKNRAMILVSHDMNFMKNTCDRAAIIHNGLMKDYSDIGNAIYDYENL